WPDRSSARGIAVPMRSSPPRLFRGLLLSLIIAFAAYAALAKLGPQLLGRAGPGVSAAAASQVSQRLWDFPLSLWLGALALASLNYAFRFVRWEYYLRLLSVRVARLPSFGIFLSGFALTVTPGKVGEVLKSFLLKEAYDVPVARTAPIVIAERLTDLLSL